jgi:hypothetical protein
MIQQFLIGRGDDCQIRLYDNTQKVSRNHATLKILENGKMFIVDHSSNGTFVNGVKITPNVDYPIKRGDNISFAHVLELNWNEIHQPKNRTILYLGGGILIIGVCVLLFFLLRKPLSQKPCPQQPVIVMDSTDAPKKQHQKEVDDSIRVAKIVKEKIEAEKKKEQSKVKSKHPEKKKDSDSKPTKPESKTEKPNIVY